MFLDAMDFYNKKNGIVVGDPVEGKVFLAYTTNKGDTWINFDGRKNNEDGLRMKAKLSLLPVEQISSTLKKGNTGWLVVENLRDGLTKLVIIPYPLSREKNQQEQTQSRST